MEEKRQVRDSEQSASLCRKHEQENTLPSPEGATRTPVCRGLIRQMWCIHTWGQKGPQGLTPTPQQDASGATSCLYRSRDTHTLCT